MQNLLIFTWSDLIVIINRNIYPFCVFTWRLATCVAVDKPRPQEQYFQESPCSEMSRDSWENWTPGERSSQSGSSSDVVHHLCVSPDYIYRACSFHTTAFMHTKTLLLISGYRIVFGASTNRKLVCVGVCVSLPCVPSYSASSQTTNWPEMQHCTVGHRYGPAINL